MSLCRCIHHSSPCEPKRVRVAFLPPRTNLRVGVPWVWVPIHFWVEEWCRHLLRHTHRLRLVKGRASIFGFYLSGLLGLRCVRSGNADRLLPDSPCCGRVLVGWDNGLSSCRTSYLEFPHHSSSTPRNRTWCFVPLSWFLGSHRVVWRCLRILRLLHDLQEWLHRRLLFPLQKSSNPLIQPL